MNAEDIGELKAAVDMYATQYNATDKLWAYFSSVSLAVLGFTVASDKFSKSYLEAVVVILGFIVFCVGNFSALYLSKLQLKDLAALARSVAEKHKVPLESFTPLSPSSVRLFYWSVVVAICVGIFLITCYRIKHLSA